MDAGPRPTGVMFPANWCARLGPMDGLPAVIDIVDAYDAAVNADCSIAGLVSSLGDQYYDWLDYLQDYTFLLAGCVTNYEPPQGGIRVFGPANTPIVGALRPRLASSEVRLLTQHYLQAFTAGLGLTAAEQEAVRAYLLQVAQLEIDPAAQGALATCAKPDAGR